MLWRLFAPLVLGGFIAICFCEPVNRKSLLKPSGTIECVGNEGDISTCRTNKSETPSPNGENQIQSSRKSGDYLGLGGGKKNKKGGNGRIVVYMLAAMKAALLYGLLNGVAALAGKAILLAKIALAIALAAILKKHDEKVSYEIVKHPHTSYIQTHSSSVDYDHRSSDYSDDRNDYTHNDYTRNDYLYEHRKRRQLIL